MFKWKKVPQEPLDSEQDSDQLDDSPQIGKINYVKL